MPNGQQAQAPKATTAAGSLAGASKTRWLMLLVVMLIMLANYMDRGNLAVAAPLMQKELSLDAAGLRRFIFCICVDVLAVHVTTALRKYTERLGFQLFAYQFLCHVQQPCYSSNYPTGLRPSPNPATRDYFCVRGVIAQLTGALYNGAI